MANSREYLMIWDSTMANPNGDMLNDDQPRHDNKTGKLEVSDVRIKRFIRDELQAKGHKILVQTVINPENGKVLSCANLIQNIATEKKLKATEIPKHLLANYIDVRLFGAVITKPKYDITGALQVTWSRSVHKADIKFMQGNAAYASADSNAATGSKEQASIWSKYITPYALFKTYAVFNSEVAKKQDVEVTDDDLKAFVNAFIYGLINYRSTSKNQMPRLLVEVIYKKHLVDGEFNYIDVSYKCDDLDLRDISQFSFDFTRLKEYSESKKDVIEKVNLYKHNSVKLDFIPAGFHVIDI
jgi:CRISPR-associated protein Csh2